MWVPGSKPIFKTEPKAMCIYSLISSKSTIYSSILIKLNKFSIFAISLAKIKEIFTFSCAFLFFFVCDPIVLKIEQCT